MQPVGLGNTRILTDFAHKSPWTLSLPTFSFRTRKKEKNERTKEMVIMSSISTIIVCGFVHPQSIRTSKVCNLDITISWWEQLHDSNHMVLDFTRVFFLMSYMSSDVMFHYVFILLFMCMRIHFKTHLLFNYCTFPGWGWGDWHSTNNGVAQNDRVLFNVSK